MSFKKQENTDCDVLIIGSGGAGLRAAIAAASSGADVLMVSKTRIGYATNTYLSKAVIASSGWGDLNDSSNVHSRDTLQGGRYLNNPDMVARITKAIKSETVLLQEWGMEFGADESGRPAVIKVPGHSYARHLHGNNWKGSDLVLPLKRKAIEKGVRFQERIFVSSLMVSDSKICGVTGISEEGKFLAVKAKTVVLATGGFGHVFLNTNNAPGTTGDGHALAFEADAALQDMEFVQFYPTALGKRGSRILLYENLLTQNGVVLRNRRGEDVLKKNGCHAPADITRDQLAQLIMKEILENPENRETIVMDLGGLSPDAARSLSMLLPAKFSKGTTLFQVVPTTHFCMGGVIVDNHGETSCTGLFAVGEVTAGAHGANRLGGNALAEIIAMGGLVGKAAADRAMNLDSVPEFDNAVRQERVRLDTMFGEQGPHPRMLIQELKETMWSNAGIIRNQQSLDRAMETIMVQENSKALMTTPGSLIRFLEFRNMRLVAELVCRSALERTESRGSHFRSDYPGENDQGWLKNIQAKKAVFGVTLEQFPVPGSDSVLS
jgi:succinate dehydrogenase/fumarate reductase flavoprotein subunit